MIDSFGTDTFLAAQLDTERDEDELDQCGDDSCRATSPIRTPPPYFVNWNKIHRSASLGMPYPALQMKITAFGRQSWADYALQILLTIVHYIS